MKTFVVTLASVAVASALPGFHPNPAPRCPSVPELATFDTLPTLPAAAELSPVGTYKGITWNALDVLEAGVAGTLVSGDVPQSGDKVAVNGVTNEVTSGAPAMVVAAPYKSFDLKSAYFGCVVNSVSSVTGVPEACTVAFTAYLPGSNVAYQTINEQFKPTNAVRSTLAKATFPDTWVGMGRVDIVVVASTTPGTLTALFLDSVSYDLHKCVSN